MTIAKVAAQTLLRLEDEPTVDTERRRQLLEMANRNIDLAVLLVDRMSLARTIESDALDLKTQVIDLGKLVCESVADLQEVYLGDRPIELEAEDGLLAEVDPTAIREIIFNVLSNAVKYSEEGAPIEVRVAGDDGLARLVVRDHGAGISEGESEKIFHKFFRGTKAASGIGLGLFISRGLARALGGDLTMRAAGQDGSEFELTIPRHA